MSTKKTKQIKTKNKTKQIKNTLLSMQSHIFTYHFYTNHVNELGNIFLFVIFWVDIYLYAPFSTSLNTLLRSSRADKLLNSICPIVILFTSFALPSTDKFAEKMSNSPDTCLSTLSIFFFFSPPYFGKTFLGERKQPGFFNIVSIIPFTFSYDKICPFLSPLSFSPPLFFFPFLLLFFNLLLLLQIPLLKNAFAYNYATYVKRKPSFFLHMYSNNPKSCCPSS